MNRTEPGNYVISYLNLRRTVGFIAIMLPIVLRVGVIVVGHVLPYSVSGYYYSPMRNILVAALCALGVFLMTYNGYGPLDSWITNIAGAAAIGVAFFPTSDPSFSPAWVSYFHVGFAAVALSSLALMSLQFTQTEAADGDAGETWRQVIRRMGRALLFRYADPGHTRTARKNLRDRIYSACAWAILAGVVLALVQNFWPASAKNVTQWLFWFEALAIVAFGFSWLVKGQTVFADGPESRDVPCRDGDGLDHAQPEAVRA